jgi:hypothetical protein
MALEPRALFVSRDQQWNFYAAGRFEESEAEYQRSRSLDGNHVETDMVALLRALARADADPQSLRDLYQLLLPAQNPQPQWVYDFGAAIPNRQEMLAVLRKAVEAGESFEPTLADALGDRDLALTLSRRLLARSRGASSAWWQPWLLVHSGARADPRFQELMCEGGLPDFWRRSGKWPDFCGPLGKDDFECH